MNSGGLQKERIDQIRRVDPEKHNRLYSAFRRFLDRTKIARSCISMFSFPTIDGVVAFQVHSLGYNRYLLTSNEFLSPRTSLNGRISRSTLLRWKKTVF